MDIIARILVILVLGTYDVMTIYGIIKANKKPRVSKISARETE